MTHVLTRYWIEFANPRPSATKLGVGVTAFDEEDAMNLVSKALTLDSAATMVHADIDVRELDQNHVIPNMGAPSIRGVWFPLT